MPASTLVGSTGHRIEDWFTQHGAYVLVDGQYGSTGKGLFAAYIAQRAHASPTVITTNQGPNSGHTALWSSRKIITKQLPVSGVVLHEFDSDPLVYLNAGAIIDPKILADELVRFKMRPPIVHPCAVIVTAADKAADEDTVKKIASTGQGTGPAVQNKVARTGDTMLYRDLGVSSVPPPGRTWDNFWDWESDSVFVETAQGFSLGLNSIFYPHVTSRECTVMQALADARIPAQMVRRVAMCVRTFPIRVGNVGSASSGDCYPDQEETSWARLGVEPELTTVTKRVRRIFTWSRQQFKAAVAANRPDVIFVNFINYLKPGDRPNFMNNLWQDYFSVMGRVPTCYYGFGPCVEDVNTRAY